ncbi:MAG TPA: SWIM zinc finger family protein [Candidatus Bathyarchaeia archaeon]|nr:SWIM zinc finger family protein [Candidatus Bathyarchaeia archaeon]
MNSDNIQLKYLDTKERKSKSEVIPLLNETRTTYSNWWTLKWLKAIEYFSDDTRIIQGKNLAIKGQVSEILIEPGKVEAKVQGNKIKPYLVRLEFVLFSEQLWERILEELSLKAEYQTKILVNEIPPVIEEICQKEDKSLFPLLKNDLKAGCNCPDWAIPCKHIAAVYYLLADMINSKPMILFNIRGKTRNEVIEIINQKRIKKLDFSNTIKDEAQKQLSLITDYTVGFWSLKNSQVNLREDEQPNSIDISKILTESPFILSNVNLSTLIRKSYETARTLALKELEKY